MATATAAAPAATGTLLDRYQAIFGKSGFLNTYNIERKDETELLGLSTISGVDVLLLGDPGVGKTWMIELLVKYCLTEMSLFTHLLAKDQTANEVLGPPDLLAFKEGKIVRLTAGMLPEANYAYLDEVFKASPPMLNPLLDLLANRVLKTGGVVQDCSQLVSVFMSSNELPDREDLMAFRDRIGVTKMVAPVRTNAGRTAVMRIQLGYQAEGIDATQIEPLTLKDIGAIRAEVDEVEVPDPIIDVLAQAQQKWLDAGHAPSQRRVGQMLKMVKSHAWASGRDKVVGDDLIPCQHMAFNHLTDAESARKIIMEFAGEFQRKADLLREQLDPMLAEMKALEAEIDGAKDDTEKYVIMYDKGVKFMAKLAGLEKQGRKQIKEGEKQGQDVSSLESVVNEIQRAHKWAEDALTAQGEDDDD